MVDADVEVVPAYRRHIEKLLARAREAKPDGQIEPPLTEAHLGDTIWTLQDEDGDAVKKLNLQAQHAAVEIAFRETFYHLVATTAIDHPAFIEIWNLLDIISIFSDNEQCEPGLIFWLIEELLDSQTIEGCRKVFDYLESRREKNTKKHFKQKSLIILRSCNELLRRLSRAEDTVFCGRVFIFLFQSFPLGDKSSVNLRGEFHTENVTTYDEIKEPHAQEDEMDLGAQDEAKQPTTPAEAQQVEVSTDSAEGNVKTPKIVISEPTKKQPSSPAPVDLDALYPMFWRLQAYFSAPTKVFDPHHFASFKHGLETTLHTFKSVKTDVETSNASKGSEDTRRGVKRKRTVDGPELASSFNPKYLTSRDLFDLEVSDTAFRRHVLVQALILLDFVLSLTPKAKARLADLTNKSVMYSFVLNDDDARWAVEMRRSIEEYLQEGLGGKFYYRMVDTVLSRDKNWVRWKAEGCPLIERPAVSVTDYLGAREAATRVYASKRLRPSPMGSLDLEFLAEGETTAGLERLKEPDRSEIPDAASFLMGIMDDEMDIDMAPEPEEKQAAIRAKDSKIWRILRLSSRNKFSEFDKIDDGKNIKALFEAPTTEEQSKGSNNEADNPNDTEHAMDGTERVPTDGEENDTTMSEPTEPGLKDQEAKPEIVSSNVT